MRVPSMQCAKYGEGFKTLVPSGVELLEDDNAVYAFLLELECAYSARFELPFLKGSHPMGVVSSEDYQTWYTGYMQAIQRWSNCPTEFFPRFQYLSAHHQIWVRLYIQCLADVFQKHKLNIRAPTQINPVNRFGRTTFRYPHARLAENERTRCLLMEAYIRVRLSHFRDEAYTHYSKCDPHFREFARLIGCDWENILEQYDADTAALLLDKRHEEECTEKVA